MVIQDLPHPHKKKRRFRSSKIKEEWPLASPVDRLAATVVDFVILIPLISLAFALVKKEIALARFFGTNPELHFLMTVYYVVSPMIIHCIYQTVFLSFLGATPGKYFFGLKVSDVWNHRYPHWQRAMLRGFLWWIDVILLMPLLSLFWDGKRRPIHDRLSDTIVTSVESRCVRPPGFWETQFSRLLFLGLTIAGGGYVFSQSPALYQVAVRNGIELSDWVGGKDTCEAVDRAENAWPEEKTKGRRLRIALALFAARTIESACLNAEADHYIWLENKSEKDQGIGYLAKAFATLEKPETSDRYLGKVCEADAASEACRMSEVFSQWSGQRWREAENQFGPLGGQSSVYVKIWAIRHFFRSGKIEKALALIEEISPNYALADFLGEYRVKSLWRNERSQEAESTFKLYWESRDDHDRLHLANWLCYEEMLQNCGGWQSPSCQVLERAVQRFPTVQEEEKVALTLLRSTQCRDEKLSNRFLSQEVASLAEATDVHQRKAGEIYDSLKAYAEDEKRNEVIRFDALWRAIDSADSRDQLRELEKVWTSFDREGGWNWAVLGRRISEKFARVGEAEKALATAQKVYRAHNGYKGILRQLVTLHFKEGRRQAAWQWLKKYRSSDRGPATVKDWESIQSSLQAEFGGK